MGKQGHIVSLSCLLHTRLNKWPETPRKQSTRSCCALILKYDMMSASCCVYGVNAEEDWGSIFLMLQFEHNVAKGQTVV